MSSSDSSNSEEMSGLKVRLALAWLFVGIPLLYGVIATVQRAIPLFTG